jgi:hypothetical protein
MNLYAFALCARSIATGPWGAECASYSRSHASHVHQPRLNKRGNIRCGGIKVKPNNWSVFTAWGCSVRVTGQDKCQKLHDSGLGRPQPWLGLGTVQIAALMGPLTAAISASSLDHTPSDISRKCRHLVLQLASGSPKQKGEP